MKRILTSFFWILAAALMCSAQNTLYFPQIADGFGTDGSAWVTAIGMTNTAASGTGVASVTIRLTQDNGSPWSVDFNDDQNRPAASGSTFSFQLGPGQSKLFISKGNELLKSGFATVTSTLPVTGGIVFIEFKDFGNTRVAEAGVPASAALTQQAMFATKNNNNTGIAVANPGSAIATITFQLLDVSGTPALPAVNRQLAASAHTAFFVNQLFPNLPEGFFGTLRITSTTAIVTTCLIFEDSGHFATLPVFPIQ